MRYECHGIGFKPIQTLPEELSTNMKGGYSTLQRIRRSQHAIKRKNGFKRKVLGNTIAIHQKVSQLTNSFIHTFKKIAGQRHSETPNENHG